MTRPRVLVVDDNPMNTKLVTYVLRGRGIDVLVAASAAETWKVLEEVLPAAILMDVQLPGVDGLTLTRQLRADTRFGAVPIVAVTAYAMDHDRRAAFEAGCSEFVSKPIDTSSFGELLTKLVASGGTR